MSTPYLQQSQSKTINSQQLYIFYTQKLTDRINAAKNNPELNQILSAKNFYLNGQSLQGFSSLYPWLLKQLKQLCQHVDIGFLHGDLCFSNILLEPASGVIRLIDPRGDFMGWVNEGDPRYDLAKLLHSVHGKYDFIINDLFNLEQHHLKFNFHTPESNYLQQLEHTLFEKIELQTCYALDDLILLESLLFITMLPLHRDQPKRQIAFLLTGLKLLNQVYESQQQHGKTWRPFTPKAIAGSTASSSTILQ